MLQSIPPQVYVIGSTIGVLFMGVLAMTLRARSAKTPLSVKKIVIPPLGMATGSFMYAFPLFRLTPAEMGEAVLIGLAFAGVLIWSTKFEAREGDVYLVQSKAFLFILGGLLLIRVIGKSILSASIDVGQLSGMFFLLAFVMIVTWRAWMYATYKKMRSALDREQLEKTAGLSERIAR